MGDTFVSLQKSYREYGSSDYRETLRTLAKRPDFLPHPLSFLHFPIPDFGVVKDPDMLALINQLADLLKKGKCLYIHCFEVMGGRVWYSYFSSLPPWVKT